MVVFTRPPSAANMADSLTDTQMLRSLHYMQSSGLPCVLLISHALGGGVERHIQELLCVLQERAHICILRPHVHASQVVLQVPVYQQVAGQWQAQPSVRLAFKWPRQQAQLCEWLHALAVQRVHVHHVIGFAASFWPRLLAMSLPLDLTLHDHSILTGNPSLLDERGHFDPAWFAQGLAALPAGDVQVAQVLQQLAAQAERVIVPSQSLADVLAQMLPGLSTLVRCHPERELLGPYPAVRAVPITPAQPLKVLCLGMLGIEKGAYALAQTAALAAQQSLKIEFILLGACHITLPPTVRCLGLYQDADLPDLIAQVQPHILWLPAQCPETWSYTLSAGLYAGLPVLASDIGALPERLRERPLTQLVTHTASAQQWLAALQALQQRICAASETGPQPWQSSRCAPFYLQARGASADADSGLAQVYLQSKGATQPCSSDLPLGLRAAQALAQQGAGRWRVAVLRALYRLARWPMAAYVVRYVPYRWQRRLKRAVSRAPLDSRTLK